VRLIHRLSTSCAQVIHSVRWLSTACPQCVGDIHKISTGYPQCVTELSTSCTQLVHSLRTVRTQHTQTVYTEISHSQDPVTKVVTHCRTHCIHRVLCGLLQRSQHGFLRKTHCTEIDKVEGLRGIVQILFYRVLRVLSQCSHTVSLVFSRCLLSFSHIAFLPCQHCTFHTVNLTVLPTV